MRNSILLLLSICVIGTACRKEPSAPTPNPPTDNGLKITVENTVNGEPLVLGSKSYKNANGDDFFVDVYKYYISNIVLTGTDGQIYKETESYHLIDQSRENTFSFKLKDIPAGNYSKLEFMVGVDSARNVSGAQTGDLDPIYQMFWDWNTGYIMAMFEGRSPQSGFNNGLTFHLAGFAGKESSVRTITLPLPLTSGNGKMNAIDISANLAEWFTKPNNISFKDTYLVVGGPECKMIADNYTDMFSISHVQ